MSWRIDGEADFMTKPMQVFVSMEKMMTPDFDAGLANIKRAAEAGR